MLIIKVIGIILLIILLLYLFLILPRMWGRPAREPHLHVLYAHRGLFDNHSDAPENSMAAFRLAVEAGYGIELDVQTTKDGVPVVFHDFTLRRMARFPDGEVPVEAELNEDGTPVVPGKICDYTWEELSQLTPSRPFGKRFPEVRIPLLSDVVDFAIEYGVRLNIEIKPSRYEEGLEKKLVELLVEKDFVSQVPSNAVRASVTLQLLHVSARSPSPPGSVSRGLATPAGPAFLGCWAPDQPAWRVSPLFSSFLTPDPPFCVLNNYR
jgi:glycerophosphoryl diester phosphodiesterase